MISEQNKKYILWAFIALVLFKFGVPILDKIKGLFSAGAAGRQTELELKENEQFNNGFGSNTGTETGLRVTHCKSVCDNIQAEILNFNQDEQSILDEANSLLTVEEILWCKNYYKNQFGKSLRAVLSSALDSDFQFYSKTRFKDLKQIVRDNL